MDKMIEIGIINGKIKCEISSEIMISDKHLPLKFKISELITNKIIWETSLNPGMWASWDNIRDINAVVCTNDNIILKEFKYNYENENLIIYEFWDYFCRINKNKSGLILGAGDGTWGEWVIPINRELIKCHLVEASKKTFSKLSDTYKNSKQMILHNDVITKDGLDCKFYEGDDDGLNTINLDYLKKIESDSTPSFEIRKTKSIEDLLSEIGKVDWIRIDIEGSDYDIIKKIPIDYLEKLIMIQYEHYHLSDEKREEIDSIILPMGFKKLVYNIDTIYYK
jgi:FkbM family methyltransferase